MITYGEVANQNPKFGVLRCNYLFKWIKDDGINRYKRRVWGVEATQNSYSSGVWDADKMTLFEEQGKFYLPWNPITSEIQHDQRLFISMLQPEPYAYRITKIKNTTPKGIITCTVKQDKFEKEHDYVQLDPNADDYGDMYANYYSSAIEPKKEETSVANTVNTESFNYSKHTLVIESPNYNVKLGASKVLTAKIYDINNQDITSEYSGFECIWDVNVKEARDVHEPVIVIDDNYSFKEGNEFKYKFKFNGDEQYLGRKVKVTCQIEDLYANASLDIVSL